MARAWKLPLIDSSYNSEATLNLPDEEDSLENHGEPPQSSELFIGEMEETMGTLNEWLIIAVLYS